MTARAWQPLESEPLGEWTLRAAGGFTRRANSVLPLGDPGIPVPEALARVTSWYAERGLPAYVQAATGAAGTQELLCAELERLGWVNEVSAQVRIGALAPIADVDADVSDVRLLRAPDERWLSRYGKVRDPDLARRMLVEGPRCGSPCWAAAGRSGGWWWTGAGPVSARWTSILSTGGRAWPRP